jgi:hypothetical protein
VPEVAADDGGIRLKLERHEAEVLRGLVSQLSEALSEGTLTGLVRGRLFPDAYESAEDQSAYEDLVGDGLQRAKLGSLAMVGHALGAKGKVDVRIAPDDLDGWLSAIADLRLAIGVSISVDEERMGAELDPSDPDASAISLVHWLGWIQGSIIEAASKTHRG